MSEKDDKAVVYSVKKGFLKKRIQNSNLSQAEIKKRKVITITIIVVILAVFIGGGLFINYRNNNPKDGIYKVTTGTSTFNEEDTQKLIKDQEQKGIINKDINISNEDDGNVQ